jgi:hypothetical protein
VLAPTSFAMVLKKTKEECIQELNKRMWLSMIENKNQLQTSHCVQDVQISSMLLRSPSTNHFLMLTHALSENQCIMGHGSPSTKFKYSIEVVILSFFLSLYNCLD